MPRERPVARLARTHLRFRRDALADVRNRSEIPAHAPVLAAHLARSPRDPGDTPVRRAKTVFEIELRSIRGRLPPRNEDAGAIVRVERTRPAFTERIRSRHPGDLRPALVDPNTTTIHIGLEDANRGLHRNHAKAIVCRAIIRHSSRRSVEETADLVGKPSSTSSSAAGVRR